MDSTALSRSDSIVLIPTYNEKENIAAIIHAVFELPRQFHILIIDDNSPDGTGVIVKDLQKQFRALSTSWNEPGNKGWEQPILQDSSGLSNTNTNTFSRWMPISPTTPKT